MNDGNLTVKFKCVKILFPPRKMWKVIFKIPHKNKQNWFHQIMPNSKSLYEHIWKYFMHLIPNIYYSTLGISHIQSMSSNEFSWLNDLLQLFILFLENSIQVVGICVSWTCTHIKYIEMLGLLSLMIADASKNWHTLP